MSLRTSHLIAVRWLAGWLAGWHSLCAGGDNNNNETATRLLLLLLPLLLLQLLQLQLRPPFLFSSLSRTSESVTSVHSSTFWDVS
jgi:hypothetical protein